MREPFPGSGFDCGRICDQTVQGSGQVKSRIGLEPGVEQGPLISEAALKKWKLMYRMRFPKAQKFSRAAKTPAWRQFLRADRFISDQQRYVGFQRRNVRSGIFDYDIFFRRRCNRKSK